MWLLLACQAPEAPLDPSLWVYEGAHDAPPPPATTAEIEAGFVAAIARLRAADPRLPYDNFVSWLGRMGEGCPAQQDHNNQLLSRGDCADGGGNAFYGYQLTVKMEQTDIDYDGIAAFHRTFQWLTGVSQITLTSGDHLESMGDAMLRDYVDEGGRRHVYAFLWGNFWDPGHTGWVREDIGMELLTLADEGEEGWSMRYEGGISQLPGDFSALSARDLQISADCPQEPSGGQLGIWRAGQWYWWAADGVCDGCAEVVGAADQPPAQICADYSPLLSWAQAGAEALPWD